MKVLIVDDHPVTRLGLGALLSNTDEIEVVGEAKDAEEAVRLATWLRPDLVVLDLRLKEGACGMKVCQKVKTTSKAPRVLIHTAYNAAGDLALAASGGADGYLHKGVEHPGLPEVLKRINAGERVWLPAFETEEAKALFADALRKEGTLTPREQEILALLLRRRSNVDIARELYVGKATVRTHVKSILRKFGLKNREALFS